MKDEYFEFLDDLRESGTTNMALGAMELRDNFGLTKPDARQIFKEWREQV